MGACHRVGGECDADGIWSCEPGQPVAEECGNGIDDDCDGRKDELPCEIELPGDNIDNDDDGSPDPSDPEGYDDGAPTSQECDDKCGACAGQPVHLRTRDMYVGPHVDISIAPAFDGAAGIEFSRIYDSRWARVDALEFSHSTDEDAQTQPNQLPLRVLGPGWRHSFDERVELDCSVSDDQCILHELTVTYRGLTETQRFRWEATGSGAGYRANSGTALKLEGVGRSTSDNTANATLAVPGRGRMVFRSANGDQGSDLHPYGCARHDCYSAYDDPSRDQLNSLRLDEILPNGYGSHRIELTYEDEVTEANACPQLVDSISGCDPGRGLLVKVESLLVDQAGEHVASSIHFRYTETSAGGYLLRDPLV